MEHIEVFELKTSNNPSRLPIKTIAVVDEPAIMTDAFYFNSQIPGKQYNAVFVNEEKGIIVSPALIPNLRIPRIDPKTKKIFSVFMSRETVFDSGTSWMREGRQNESNQMHDGVALDGINWFSSFFTDEVFIPKVNKFEHLEVGTWFVMGKIIDPAIRAKFKAGELKGISIEGDYDMEPHQTLPLDQFEAMVYESLTH